MKLYEISGTYLHALGAFTDPESDFDAETVSDTLEALEGEFEQKAVNVAAFLRGMEAEADAIEAAMHQMAKRRHRLKANADWLRGYLLDQMGEMGLKEIRSPWFVIKPTKNPPAVVVDDPAALPAEFMWQPEPPPPAPDKGAIKEALSAGREVPGARLVVGTRLAIK
jgi:hypothetical protein